ncbi:MAG: leucine-rich repeat protein [Christensenellales bacterium]
MRKKVLRSMLMEKENEISELKQRNTELSSRLENSKTAQTTAADLLAEAEQQLLGYDKYLQKAVHCYLAEARKTADEHASRVKQDAESYAEKIRKDIDKERNELLENIRRTAGHTIEGASTALIKSLDDMKNMVHTATRASQDMLFKSFAGKAESRSTDDMFAQSMANVLTRQGSAEDEASAWARQIPFWSGTVEFNDPAEFMAVGAYGFRNNVLLNRITIPDGVSQIPPGFFYGCTGLQNVTIPHSVVSVSDYAFFGCTHLTEVHIAGNSRLEHIGNAAFSSCISLASIHLPLNVKHIGRDAFKDCASLEQACLDSSQPSFDLGAYAFQSCNKLSKVILPKPLKVLDQHTFDGCSSLQYIVIPENVTDVKSSAFRDCTSLHQIVIEPSLITLEADSFSNLPDHVKVYVKTHFVERSVLGVLANAHIIMLDEDVSQTEFIKPVSPKAV